MVKVMQQIVRHAGTLECSPADVGGISEITILPDGRLYVLGLSESIWELLEAAGPWGGLASDRRPRPAAERGDEAKESEA